MDAKRIETIESSFKRAYNAEERKNIYKMLLSLGFTTAELKKACSNLNISLKDFSTKKGRK